MGAQITDPARVRAFVCAGNATFTLVSKKTGARFTYRVRKTAPEKPAFVSVLTGPDNTSDFEYLGVIFEDTGFRVTQRSRIRPDAPSALAFGWFWQHIDDARLHERVEFWHTGRCGRCGRLLTVPESIETGLGPVCEAA